MPALDEIQIQISVGLEKLQEGLRKAENEVRQTASKLSQTANINTGNANVSQGLDSATNSADKLSASSSKLYSQMTQLARFLGVAQGRLGAFGIAGASAVIAVGLLHEAFKIATAGQEAYNNAIDKVATGELTVARAETLRNRAMLESIPILGQVAQYFNAREHVYESITHAGEGPVPELRREAEAARANRKSILELIDAQKAAAVDARAFEDATNRLNVALASPGASRFARSLTAELSTAEHEAQSKVDSIEREIRNLIDKEWYITEELNQENARHRSALSAISNEPLDKQSAERSTEDREYQRKKNTLDLQLANVRAQEQGVNEEQRISTVLATRDTNLQAINARYAEQVKLANEASQARRNITQYELLATEATLGQNNVLAFRLTELSKILEIQQRYSDALRNTTNWQDRANLLHAEGDEVNILKSKNALQIRNVEIDAAANAQIAKNNAALAAARADNNDEQSIALEYGGRRIQIETQYNRAIEASISNEQRRQLELAKTFALQANNADQNRALGDLEEQRTKERGNKAIEIEQAIAQLQGNDFQAQLIGIQGKAALESKSLEDHGKKVEAQQERDLAFIRQQQAMLEFSGTEAGIARFPGSINSYRPSGFNLQRLEDINQAQLKLWQQRGMPALLAD